MSIEYEKITPELRDFLNENLGRESVAGWEKSVYKSTDCGAWIDIPDKDTVKLGSIVEGSDECTDVQVLTWPFTYDEFWNALTQVEDDAKQIWDNTHGCEKCWPDGCYDPEFGLPLEFGNWPINPECKACNGEGVIL